MRLVIPRRCRRSRRRSSSRSSGFRFITIGSPFRAAEPYKPFTGDRSPAHAPVSTKYPRVRTYQHLCGVASQRTFGAEIAGLGLFCNFLFVVRVVRRPVSESGDSSVPDEELLTAKV